MLHLDLGQIHPLECTQCHDGKVEFVVGVSNHTSSFPPKVSSTLTRNRQANGHPVVNSPCPIEHSFNALLQPLAISPLPALDQL